MCEIQQFVKLNKPVLNDGGAAPSIDLVWSNC